MDDLTVAAGKRRRAAPPPAPVTDETHNPHLESIADQMFAGLAAEPRPYQRRIVAKAATMFGGGFRDRAGKLESAAGSVMIESPTGSGKTVMGLAIARHLQRTYGYSVGWVAMRRNLLAQAEEENRQRGFGVDMRTISMFDRNPGAADVLVIDEAQHDAARTMCDLHSTVRPKLILGLTATPFRTDKIKLCFDKVIRDAGIHALVQDGYLSQYRHFTIPEHTPEAIAEFYLREPQRWGKTLVFFHRRDQCETFAKLLAAAEVGCEVVTATSDRDRQLEDFAAGRVPVLANMAILTEGFDCPALETVFLRPSAKGCTIQMGGRVFRRHADFPVKQLVQCRKTPHPFPKTARPIEQYMWEDAQWKALTINKHLQRITNNSLKLIAQTKVELPAVVQSHRPKPAPWLRFARNTNS